MVYSGTTTISGIKLTDYQLVMIDRLINDDGCTTRISALSEIRVMAKIIPSAQRTLGDLHLRIREMSDHDWAKLVVTLVPKPA